MPRPVPFKAQMAGAAVQPDVPKVIRPPPTAGERLRTAAKWIGGLAAGAAVAHTAYEGYKVGRDLSRWSAAGHEASQTHVNQMGQLVAGRPGHYTQPVLRSSYSNGPIDTSGWPVPRY